MQLPWPCSALLFLLLSLTALSGALAQENEEAEPTYTDRGADRCLKCHDEFSKFPVMDIFKTKHAEIADPRTPMAKLQCETCHGPGSTHAELGDEEGQEEKARSYIRSFRRGGHTPVAEQNRLCLSCHDDGHRDDWRGSAHQTAEVACSDCHQVHATHDAALTTSEQPKVCFQCHTRERSESYRASSHPIRHGLMNCSSCHEPHGSLTEAMLRRSTLNQTCYDCHAEKRGPFLWEHAPVSEDCSHCHQPHGSNHPALLAQRPPLLCQRCHSQAGHPSINYTGDLLPGSSPAAGMLLGRSCLNCHSQVHGSNHPSGVNLKR